jgi:GNAT superfamily N-acetyltransferase
LLKNLSHHLVKTKILTDSQFQQINHLWNLEYPLNLNGRFPILLNDVQNFQHYLLEDENKNILAWAVYFEKDGEIRFSIIVDELYQGKGLGKLLIQQLKTDLDEFYGWVIDRDGDLKSNEQPYQSPLGFYPKLGFEILEDQRIDSEMLQAVKIHWNEKRGS